MKRGVWVVRDWLGNLIWRGKADGTEDALRKAPKRKSSRTAYRVLYKKEDK